MSTQCGAPRPPAEWRVGRSSRREVRKAPAPDSTSCQPPTRPSRPDTAGATAALTQSSGLRLGVLRPHLSSPVSLADAHARVRAPGLTALALFPSVSTCWLGTAKAVPSHNSGGHPSHRRQSRGTGSTRVGCQGLPKQRPPGPSVHAPAMRHSQEQSSEAVKRLQFLPIWDLGAKKLTLWGQSLLNL